ncbi:antA/AntB antirepressor family protein [Georhizobium sp. MAB10]|uniref:antA/AntB antirepressor family protein n=1 Tax=Georhizobium sp. MAB10 TaxID=3028319 RepID=UPI0038560959
MTDKNNFPIVAESQIGGATIQTVNARNLHAFLKVGKVFGAWINERIEQYEFAENVDFVVFSEIGNNPQGGRPSKEYALSLDMAKELSMVERNDQGKRARQYFIQCERRAKDPATALNNPAMLRHLLLENVEKVLALEADIAELRPLADSYEHLTRRDGTMCITDASKALGMRPKDLFAFLQAKRWIYRRAGNGHWVGYQDKVQAGLLDHRVEEVTRADGSSKITEQVRITAKGLAKLGSLTGSSAEAAE